MNRKAVVAFLVVLLLSSFVSLLLSIKADSAAPEIQWSKNYNGFKGWKTIQTSDGGFALAEETLDHVPMAIKVDADGNRQWEKTYQIDGVYGVPRSIVQSADGGYILLIGHLLLKLDSNGDTQWTKNMSSYIDTISYTTDIISSSDGGYVIVGSTWRISRNYAIVFKVDDELNLLWSKEFYDYSKPFELQLASECTANSVIETKDGNYAFTGSWAWGSAWLCELDYNGNIVLNETYPSGPGYSYGISQTYDGGFILAGDDMGGRSSGTSGYLLRTDSQGTMLWVKSFTIDNYSFKSAVQTPDGGFLAAGAYSTGANRYNLVMQLDASGEVQWTITFESTPSGNTARNAIVTKDGSYMIGGELNGGTWLAKLTPKPSPTASPTPQSDSMPALQWNRTYPRLPDSNFVDVLTPRENRYPFTLDEGRLIVQVADGNYFLVGRLNNHSSVPHSGGIDEYSGGIVKTDSEGTLQWGISTSQFTYPNWAYPTSDSGFVIIADYRTLIKYNSQGAVMMNKTYGNMSLSRVIQSGDGGFVLTGSVPYSDYKSKGVIMKTDQGGNVLWKKTLDNGSLHAVAITEGGYAFAGGLDGSIWFATTDSDGNFMANQTYMQGYAYSITKTKNGSYIVSGSDQSSYNNAKGLILKLDSVENLQWSYRVSQPQYPSFSVLKVIQSVDDGYIVLGGSALFKMDDSGNVIWVAQSVGSVSSDLVITDAKGNQLSSKSFDGVLNGYLLNGSPYSIAVTNDGGFVLGGIKDNWFWMAKFAPELPNTSPYPSTSLSSMSSTPASTSSITPSPTNHSSASPELPIWAVTILIAVVMLIAGILIGKSWDPLKKPKEGKK
jgi:hypothetical protein